MAKTLKDFLEGYLKVKSADEQKFIDKHVTAKNPDRNGNGDDVFKGSTKAIDRRKERKGYNPGEDEKVYEALKGNQHKIDKNHNGKIDAQDFKLLKKKKVAEEAEQIDELSEPTVRTYYNKAGEQGKKIADKMKMGGGDWSNDGSDTKTLKKRAAGRTMALKRRSGEIKMSEEAEQVDETSNAYRDRFGPGGINDKKRAAMHMLTPDDTGSTAKARTPEEHKTRHNELLNIASNKNTTLARLGKMAAHSYKVYHDIKEDSEQIDELEEKLSAKSPMGSYIKDFAKSDAPQFAGKSASKRRVMAIAAKLSAERGGKPLRKEERLQNRINDLTETHQRTMMHVFEKLSEDNKSKFLEACDTPEGVEQMLDFAINNRGE